MDLIDSLIKDGVLKTPALLEAFKSIDRGDFVPAHMRVTARHANHALPIGYEQTISQPWTVAFMLELLSVRPEQKILDIGAGSGWTTALLAHVVSQKRMSKSKVQISNQIQISNAKEGRVFAMERVEELCRFGEENVKKYNFVEDGIVEFRCGDAKNGWEEEAPFDRIIAAAALASGKGLDSVPVAWREQLLDGGIIVVPIGNSIWRFLKNDDESFTSEEYPGFVFVPFVSDEAKQ